MGKHDTPVAVWLSDKERFADLFNGALCNGEEIFKADHLERSDTRQNMTLKEMRGKDVHIQRFRDISMKHTDGTKLILLACENQDTIHYAMPIRSMLYDSLDYTEQVKEIEKGNRKNKNYRNGAEFLSGMTKEDRLIPIIPIVFYYGEKEWDGCRDLHSLLNISEEEYKRLKEYIPNYKMNLVDAKELVKKNCLHTDLQLILGMLEYRKDKKKLVEYIKENSEYFESIDVDSYNAAKALLDSEIHLKELEQREEKVNMCKALEDLYQDGVNEGIEKYNRLILKLSESGKIELIVKVASDADFREQLYREYDI